MIKKNYQDEVDEFLARGGKIKYIEPQCIKFKEFVKDSVVGRFYHREMNKKIRQVVFDAETASKLSRLTGVNFDDIQDYASGKKQLTVKTFNEKFKQAVRLMKNEER